MNNTQQSRGIERRGFLGGASRLTAAGWIAGLSGGWVLRPRWAHAAGPIKMGIATDITGPIAVGGIPSWQAAQLAVEKINAGGGILGQPIELFLEDTASDPKIAVGNVRRLIQDHKVDVVLGGITSAMRQAIKDPIVNRGRTLYIYPELYRGSGMHQVPVQHGANPGPAMRSADPLPDQDTRQEALWHAVGELYLAATAK